MRIGRPAHRICRVAVAALVTVGVVLCAGGSDTNAQRPAQPGLEGAGKPRYEKLGSRLSALAMLEPGSPVQQRAIAENFLSLGQAVPVTIRVADLTDEASEYVTVHGGRVANAVEDVVEAYVPVMALAGLADLGSVVRVSEILPPEPRVVSEGAAIHGATSWNAAGLTGQGVRVGIIDGGFSGYAALIGTEVPSPAAVRCYVSLGVHSSSLASCPQSSAHGTAVAEALVDMAPQVSIYLGYSASDLDFRSLVEWMQSQGVTVINYSMAGVWDGPGDGTSPYSDSKLRTVDWASSNGITFVAAAGNEGRSTWFGAFIDSNGNGSAEFSGADSNAVDLVGGRPVTLQLRWQDSWTNASRDLDLYLLDSSGTIVSASADYQDGAPGRTPFEALAYTPLFSGRFQIVVDRYSGTVPGWLQLQVFTSQTLVVNSGGAYSIGNPAEGASPGLLAAGAAPWYANTSIEPFSSQGPTPDGRLKPEVVGVDRGNSATSGPNGFAGTSQASPHVAGLAALVKQRYPSYTPAQVAATIKSWALPRGGTVPNTVWGYGLACLSPIVSLPAPVNLTATPVSQSQINLAWQSGGGTPADYHVERVTGTSGTWAEIGTSTGATYIDTGLTCGTIYSYRVRAQSSSGAFSAYSNSATATTALCPSVPIDIDPTMPAPWYFAEGYTTNTTNGFETFYLIANEHEVDVLVRIYFSRDDGWVSRKTFYVPAHSQFKVRLGDSVYGVGLPGSYGTVFQSLTSGRQIYVARSLFWGVNFDGSTLDVATQELSATWYFAEGTRNSNDYFSNYYLFLNPTTQAATGTITFFLQDGLPLVTKPIVVPAGTRVTVNPYVYPELRGLNFSATIAITNGVGIVAERAMYWGANWQGGHASTGVTRMSNTWFFAEGASFRNFDTWYLILNPNPTAVTLEVTYLLESAAPVVRTYPIVANSRFTIFLANEVGHPGGVSARMRILGGEPIVAERSMYWNWVDGTNVFGSTATAGVWHLPEGAISPGFETYVLISNSNPQDITVELTLYSSSGQVYSNSIPVGANRRHTVPIESWLRQNGQNVANFQSFAMRARALGAPAPQIVVEEALYWLALPNFLVNYWKAGGATLGIRQ